MRIATSIALALALLAAAPAAAVVERADTVPTYIGGFGGLLLHPISGDGGRVVLSDAVGDDWEIYVWEHETGVTRITDENTKPGTNVVFALDVDSDGTAVAATASGDLADTGATTTELYRWTEESGWERLTFTPGTISKLLASQMAISEDGTRIAFVSRDDYTGDNPSGELQIFLWDEGAGFTQVTHGFPCASGGGNFLADLSGDGSRILFTSRCRYGTANEDLDQDLFLWDEATGVRALTETKGGGVGGITVSLDRDGTVAALVSFHDLTGEGLAGVDYLYRWVDGQGFELLTKEPIARSVASISADGNRIAYVAANGQGTDEVNPEGTPELFFWQQGLPDVAALTDSAQVDQSLGNVAPHLSADGTRLSMFALRAFDAPADLRTGHYVIDVLSPQERKPNLLVNGSFDTGLGGWVVAKPAMFSPDDGKADPASGSALQPNEQAGGGEVVTAIAQCVRVTPGAEYVISGLLRIVSAANTGSARLGVHLYSTGNCAGFPFTTLTAASIARGDGAWIGAHGRFAVPPNPTSANSSAAVLLLAGKNEPGGSLAAGFDDVDLRRDNEIKILP